MDLQILIDLGKDALLLVVYLSLPFLGAAVLAGLLASLLQMFTKMSEPAIAYVPKIVAVLLALVLAGPFVAGRVVAFTERVWSYFQAI